jgi:hypothetical protein
MPIADLSSSCGALMKIVTYHFPLPYWLGPNRHKGIFDEPFALGIGEAEQQLLALFLERAGDVFQENEAEANVLVFRGVHVPAQLVGGSPELGLKIKDRAVGLFFDYFLWPCKLTGIVGRSWF